MTSALDPASPTERGIVVDADNVTAGSGPRSCARTCCCRRQQPGEVGIVGVDGERVRLGRRRHRLQVGNRDRHDRTAVSTGRIAGQCRPRRTEGHHRTSGRHRRMTTTYRARTDLPSPSVSSRRSMGSTSSSSVRAVSAAPATCRSSTSPDTTAANPHHRRRGDPDAEGRQAPVRSAALQRPRCRTNGNARRDRTRPETLIACRMRTPDTTTPNDRGPPTSRTATTTSTTTTTAPPPLITGTRTIRGSGVRCATSAGFHRCGDRRSTTPSST